MAEILDNPLTRALKKRLEEYNEAITKLNEAMVDYGDSKVLLRKTNVVVENLAQVVLTQGGVLECFIQKEMYGLETKTIKKLEDKLMEQEQELKIAKNTIEKLKSDARKSENRNVVPKTSKAHADSIQKENSVPESLLLDHIQTVDSEKSTVTIFGIPNQDFKNSYEETGKRIVGEVMAGEKFQAKSVKHVKNTKHDKPNTFRLLIRFPSPNEAQKFVENCGKTVKWSYRLGMTKLERHYSKQTVLKISEMNRNLSKDCGYKYIKKGLFSIVRSSS